jgi:hypothetical protein
MTPSDPQTQEDAIAMGYVPATDAQWNAFIAGLPHTFDERIPVDCADKPPHTKCLETPCLQGFKGVVFCNDQDHLCHGERFLIPC